MIAWLLLVTSQIRMKVNLWKKIKAVFNAFWKIDTYPKKIKIQYLQICQLFHKVTMTKAIEITNKVDTYLSYLCFFKNKH